MLYHSILYHIISYDIVSYDIIWYHMISYDIRTYNHLYNILYITYNKSYIIYHIRHHISYVISYHIFHTFPLDIYYTMRTQKNHGTVCFQVFEVWMDLFEHHWAWVGSILPEGWELTDLCRVGGRFLNKISNFSGQISWLGQISVETQWISACFWQLPCFCPSICRTLLVLFLVKTFPEWYWSLRRQLLPPVDPLRRGQMG